MMFLILIAIFAWPFESHTQMIIHVGNQSNCSSSGLNIKHLVSAILSFIENNSRNLSICDSNYILNVSDDNWICVKGEENVGIVRASKFKSDQNASNIAADCPSFVCPINPTCKQGFHLLTHGENCCCIIEDVEKSSGSESTLEPEVTEATTEAVTEAVTETVTESVTEAVTTANADDQTDFLAPDCPAFSSLNIATCNPGFQLLVHGDNSCCLKEEDNC